MRCIKKLGAVGAWSALVWLTACGSNTSSIPDDLDAVAEVTHESTSAIDDAFTGVSREPRLTENWWNNGLAETFSLSSARTSCFSISFNCSSGTATRNFGSGCTMGFGSLTRTGTVTLTLADTNGSPTCSFNSAKTITRASDFTVSARRTGSTLTVSSLGVTAYDTSVSFGSGQRLTKKDDGTFTWEALGMNRRLTNSASRALFDISNKTASDAPLTISGSTRATRKIVSGKMLIYHNLAEYTAELTFDNLGWSSSCNEPVSGSVSGTVSGSRTGTFTQTFDGCGTSNLSYTESGKEPATESVTSDSSAEI